MFTEKQIQGIETGEYLTPKNYEKKFGETITGMPIIKFPNSKTFYKGKIFKDCIIQMVQDDEYYPDIEGATFENVTFESSEGLGEDVWFNTLKGCSFTNCTFDTVIFEQSDLEGSVFTSCSFQECLFNMVNLRNTIFSNCYSDPLVMTNCNPIGMRVIGGFQDVQIEDGSNNKYWQQRIATPTT
jgi:hypothetical protein